MICAILPIIKTAHSNPRHRVVQLHGFFPLWKSAESKNKKPVSCVFFSIHHLKLKCWTIICLAGDENKDVISYSSSVCTNNLQQQEETQRCFDYILHWLLRNVSWLEKWEKVEKIIFWFHKGKLNTEPKPDHLWLTSSTEPKTNQTRPWRLISASGAKVLSFVCPSLSPVILYW